MTNDVLFERCEHALQKVARFIPSGETDLAYEIARCLEELEKRPKPRVDFKQLTRAVEAAGHYEPSTDGRKVLPAGDR